MLCSAKCPIPKSINVPAGRSVRCNAAMPAGSAQHRRLLLQAQTEAAPKAFALMDTSAVDKKLLPPSGRSLYRLGDAFTLDEREAFEEAICRVERHERQVGYMLLSLPDRLTETEAAADRR
jgi:hypothetical protein